MIYEIFNFENDSDLIKSFLETASLSHKEGRKSEAWFWWKFRDNPFGSSILACAIDNNKVVGCVAFGMQDFQYNGSIIKAAISFETFVHPDYQGKGIFKNLIFNAEQEAKSRNITFLINFPNSNSLPGFLKTGWKTVKISEYWLKPKNLLTSIFNISEIKNPFVIEKNNLTELLNQKINIPDQISDKRSIFSAIYDKDYLKWRFFKFPVSEYVVVDDENTFAISRIGYRGKLKELQVLVLHSKNFQKLSIRSIEKSFYKCCKYDLISFPISNKNSIRSKLIKNCFIKVPNNINITCKLLDESNSFSFDELSLQAINYHTY